MSLAVDLGLELPSIEIWLPPARALPRVSVGMGSGTNITADVYLKYYNGTVASATNGYCMMRGGSITGVSASAQVTVETTPGTVDIEVKVNGSTVFAAQETTSGTGDYNWSGTQASGVDNFSIDDVICLYVNFGTFVGTINDFCATVELEQNT